MNIPSTSSGLLMYLQTKRLSSRGTWLGCKKISKSNYWSHKLSIKMYKSSLWPSTIIMLSKEVRKMSGRIVSSVWLTLRLWLFSLKLAYLIIARREWQAYSPQISTHMIDKINSSTSWWSNRFYNPRFSILQECR